MACPNCGSTMHERFCAHCGQKAAPLNPSALDVVHDFAQEVLNVDSKIFLSVRLLLTRPGWLSHELFLGRRARYVSAFRLYLLFSVLYFAVAAVAPAAAFRVTVTPGPADSPQETARLEQRRQELQRVGSAAITQWMPRAMFLLVPIFAALVALAGRRSGRNYPQHLYFALHVHAAWFFALAVAAAARIRTIPVLTRLAAVAATLYIIVYLVIAFRRTYGVTTKRAIVRTIAAGGGYAIVLAGTILLIVLAIFGTSGPRI